MPDKKREKRRQELLKMSDEELDDLVIDTKEEEASLLNAEGREAQIDYILNWEF